MSTLQKVEKKEKREGVEGPFMSRQISESSDY